MATKEYLLFRDGTWAERTRSGGTRMIARSTIPEEHYVKLTQLVIAGIGDGERIHGVGACIKLCDSTLVHYFVENI